MIVSVSPGFTDSRVQPMARSRVGVSAHQLGVDFCLGRYVWDRQHKFRLCLGPLDLPGYAIGGVSVGEGHESMVRVVKHTAPLLPAARVRGYLTRA